MAVSHGGDFAESLTPPTECFAYNFQPATPYNDELNAFTAMTATDDHILLHKPQRCSKFNKRDCNRTDPNIKNTHRE